MRNKNKLLQFAKADPITENFEKVRLNKAIQEVGDHTLISGEEINLFVKWISKLNPADYPTQKQIINQLQRYNVASRITSIIGLWNIFIGGKHE